MLIVATLWWILFFAVVGLSLGSYLNVVIYRVPRGISTFDPRWSFCPRCGVRIHWFDNIPVLSYFLLGGRCRACGVRISPRYLTVELLMAILALVVLDAFCVAGLRGGTHDLGLGVTEQLYYDWPIILAHVVLFGCLLALSAIDLEHYFIDIRFTNIAVVIGFAVHLIWTPAVRAWVPTVGGAWHRPSLTTGVVCIAMTVVVGLTWLALRLLLPLDQEEDAPAVAEPGEADEDTAAETPDSEDAAPNSGEDFDPIPTTAELPTTAAWLAVLVFLFLVGAMVVDILSSETASFRVWCLLVPIAACFVLIVGVSAPRRHSDTAIIEAIESERFSARAMVLQELLLLVPAILAGVVVAWLCLKHDAFGRWCEGWLAWCPRGSWQPLTGLATAASGYVIGGAIGWAVRILFTLVLGREAFGTGDIHLMAAVGCVAGWPVVLIGFVLTSFLALLGWVVTLPFKRTRAIPLVPWLSLAFLIVVVFHNRLCELGPVRNTIELFKLVTSGEFTGMMN